MEREKEEKEMMGAGKDSADECIEDSGQKKRPNISHLAISRPPPLLRQIGKGGGWEERGRKMNGKKVEKGKHDFGVVGRKRKSTISKSFVQVLDVFSPYFPSSYPFLPTGGSFDVMHGPPSPSSLPTFLFPGPDDDVLPQQEHGDRHQQQPCQHPWRQQCSLATETEKNKSNDVHKREVDKVR